MKGKIVFGIGVVFLLVICFCVFWISGAGSTYYYSQIDNSKIEKADMNGGVIDFNGNMEYFYTLHSYDENGVERDITFGTSRKLKEEAFIRLTVMPIRGVIEWNEVQYDELPITVQKKYALPK